MHTVYRRIRETPFSRALTDKYYVNAFSGIPDTANEVGETMYHQPVQNELPLIIFVELVGDSTYLSSKMSGTFSAHMRHAL